jgi:hypothetical protein
MFDIPGNNRKTEDRDQTGSDLAAKAPRWFTDNMQSDRGVKRSMSEESDDYTYIPPKMDLLSQEQRVKSSWIVIKVDNEGVFSALFLIAVRNG